MDNIYAIIPVTTFKNAKTRLSPFLSEEERENLLKAMLQDVTDTLKKHVDKENDNSNLNKALTQAMKICKGKTRKVIIVPSDIPLIGKTNVQMLIDASKSLDFIIVPSKGGGTNMIIMKPMAIRTRYEGFSYEEHLQAAERKKLNPQVHDSFFMALDVNTTEDLGEIMIHGKKTHTRQYLKELKVNVESFRGSERLKVTRDD